MLKRFRHSFFQCIELYNNYFDGFCVYLGNVKIHIKPWHFFPGQKKHSIQMELIEVKVVVKFYIFIEPLLVKVFSV